MSNLSLRLAAVAENSVSGDVFWDLCCDHGHLGIWAARSGLFREVIFNDCVPELIASLESKLKSLSAVRTLCTPAELIAEPVRGNVKIAGVGGMKIHRILKALSDSGWLQAQHISVCPEKHAEWLIQQPITGYVLERHWQIPHNKGGRWILNYKVDSLESVI